MKSLAVILATACVALSPVAHAQRAIDLHARTAGELAELCGTPSRDAGADAKLNFCHGFAQGVVDDELKHGKPFCFPSPAPSRGATLRQFVDWVHESSDRRSQSAVDGLMHFLAERYPCKG